MRIRVILAIIIATAFASVIAQIGENNLIITITSDGKAKVTQALFPKTYVSTIDVDLISSQISNMLVTDEKDVFLGTTQNEDSVKIATLGASAVDLKYNADVISYESGVFRLKYNSEQESRVILPPLSKIASINTIPIEVNERDYLLPPGNISISYTIRPVTSQEFIIPIGDKEQKIEAITAAKIEEFAANDKEIQFIIKDKATILVIIPTLVLANPDDITLNNEQVDFREFHQNSTHSWIRIEPHEKGLVKISDSSPVSDDGGGCLIATAAYGTEMAPQVQFLREIRDSKVMSTTSGALFMSGFNQFYYSFSPSIADLERENPIFKEIVKIGITPLIYSLSIMSVADSEHEILGFGIVVILIGVGIYFVLPVAIFYEVKKIVRTRHVRRSNLSVKCNIAVNKALKTSLFGVMVVLVLLVSVSSAFAQSDESESPIRMILDLTRNNLLESLDSTSEIPYSAQTFYDMGQVEYEKAIAALEEGNTEAAKEHALIAMALYEDSASIVGSLEESRVLDQLPEGFGNAIGSASEQGVENGQGLGVGGIPPGIMKQMLASSIFEMQEEITDVDVEVENLKDLISSNNLNIDLSEYDKAINLTKEVLANGDIPNAQAKLALANEIKSDLYDQINLAVAENQDERIDEFVEKSISNIEELLSKGENLGLTKNAISELEDTLEALKSGNIDDVLEKTSDKSDFANEIKNNKEAEKELKDENNAEEKELKDENNAEEKELKDENNGNPSELSNNSEISNDEPSDNADIDNLENIPPDFSNLDSFGDAFGVSSDSFGDVFSFSSADDYFENHFEDVKEEHFEISFDGTNKGNGKGKGNLGDPEVKTDSGNNVNTSTNQDSKVTICHKGKNTLTVSTSAVGAHLEHGDTLGSCDGAVSSYAPVITLIGSPTVSISKDATYTEQGATCTDPQDGPLPVIQGGDLVDTSIAGVYTITYDCQDSELDIAIQAVRIVTVVDGNAPVLTINGDNPICFEKNGSYSDRVSTASDIEDGDITGSITVSGNTFAEIEAGKKGDVFTRTYSITDTDGNMVTKDLVINVENPNGCKDNTKPKITLKGSSKVDIVKDVGTYTELGATTDDGSPVVISGTNPDESAPVGTIFIMNYDATDLAGNNAIRVQRIVTIVLTDTTSPIITLNGLSNINIVKDVDMYVELGATTDDGSPVVISGDTNPDESAPVGTIFTINYDATDSAGNNAVRVQRTVTIVAAVVNTAPIVTSPIPDVSLSKNPPDTSINLGTAFNDAEDTDAVMTYSIKANTNSGMFNSVTIAGTTLTIIHKNGNSGTGTANITITATDTGGLSVDDTFTVTVGSADTTSPIITLNGLSNINIVKDVDMYVELGATTDDGSPVVISGDTNPDESAPVGTIFTINYDATDSAGNNAVRVQRTVTIVAAVVNTAPIVTSGGIPDVSKSGNNQISVIQLADYFEDVEDLDNLTYTITGDTFDDTNTNWGNPPAFSGTQLTLDFANGASGKGTGTLTVRATDTGGLFVEDTFTVTLS